jgi:KEOPS complex subunit Cgi121
MGCEILTEVSRVLSGYVVVEDIGEYFALLKDCEAAILDAKYLIDIENAIFAAEKAIKAWDEGRNIAKTLPMEILLHAAATRQIKDALEVGLKKGKNTVFAVLLDCDELPGFVEGNFKRLKPDEKQLRKIKEFYDITDEELEIVGTERLNLLIRERIALFNLK